MVIEDNKNLPFSQKPHVLVVDDDARIRDLLYRYLSENGFVVVAAADASEAWERLEVFEFDVLVLDIMMPGETGLEFSVKFRKSYEIPVLFLTALGAMEDKILGFQSGGDDYLVKPFEPQELVFRLHAILRRTMKVNPGDLGSFRMGEMIYDAECSELRSESGNIVLTSGEVTLIEALAVYKGEVVDRKTLAGICGVDPNGRSIDVQITRLRQKIEENTKSPRYLKTVRGKGYMLRTENV